MGYDDLGVVVNSCLEAQEGRMGLNRLGKLVSQVRERRNTLVEVRSEPRFWGYKQEEGYRQTMCTL